MNLRLRSSILGISVTMLAAACGGSPNAGPATPATTTVVAPAPAATGPAQKVSDAPAPADTDGKIKWALAGAQRTDKEKARDAYRHPLETLEFFGLKDDMTVVELWPGGGWYTEILAPVLHDKGKLVVTTFDPVKAKNEAEHEKEYDAKLAGAPAIYGNVVKQPLIPSDPTFVLGPEGSADMVLTFRNFHNWISAKIATKVISAAFKVLKPGGTFGIVEHRASPGDTKNVPSESGYVNEELIIEAAQMAGFKLDQKSEINANPKDTKDYPKGVWALPPVYRNGDVDRAKYQAIGESDRMTLKFVKPAK